MARRKRKFTLRIRFLLLIAGIVVAAVMYFNQEAKLKEIQQERDTLNHQKAQLLNDTQRLERIISYSQTQEYAEQIAREQLGWVKPGDIKFIDKK